METGLAQPYTNTDGQKGGLASNTTLFFWYPTAPSYPEARRDGRSRYCPAGRGLLARRSRGRGAELAIISPCVLRGTGTSYPFQAGPQRDYHSAVVRGPGPCRLVVPLVPACPSKRTPPSPVDRRSRSRLAGPTGPSSPACLHARRCCRWAWLRRGAESPVNVPLPCSAVSGKGRPIFRC